MNGYVLDTSALSRFAPGKPPIPSEVAEKLRRQHAALFVPTIAIAEVRAGICKAQRTGATTKAAELGKWFLGFRFRFAAQVLDFDQDAADRAGEIGDAAMGLGRHPGFADVAIAGIARARGMAVLTENVRHFQPLGIPVYTLETMP